MLLSAEELDKISRKDRVALIDAEIHRLQCERRLAMLTDRQWQDMANTGLSDAAKKKLSTMSCTKDQDAYFMQLARADYFKQLAWASYINGDTPHPPMT